MSNRSNLVGCVARTRNKTQDAKGREGEGAGEERVRTEDMKRNENPCERAMRGVEGGKEGKDTRKGGLEEV